MSVTDKHPDFDLYLKSWQRTRDAVKGTVAVKAKKQEYLPVPDAESYDERQGVSTVRYKQYIKRALFTNFTGRTKNALVGAAFRKEPSLELPTQLEYLEEDATGDGLGLIQLSKDELSNILETGRTFLLVDYPQAEEGLSAEDVSRLDLRASIIPYTAEQVINWKTSVMAGRKVLTLVVLAEEYSKGDDEFSHDTDTQYRVLRLREEGYSQQIYRDNEPYTVEVFPRKSDGTIWEEIPGIFVGSKNNDATIDDAPLSDIADVNIAHYQNSADYEESCFLTGQPTLFLTHSLSMDQWLEYNPNGIKLGSRSGFVLGDIVQNLSMGIQKCVEWVGEFMGASDSEVEFEINREFYDKTVDPQMLMSMVTLLDRQILADQDIFDRLKAAGIVEGDRTLEDIRAELGELNPLAGSEEVVAGFGDTSEQELNRALAESLKREA
jgi:hypothetical protein